MGGGPRLTMWILKGGCLRVGMFRGVPHPIKSPPKKGPIGAHMTRPGGTFYGGGTSADNVDFEGEGPTRRNAPQGSPPSLKVPPRIGAMSIGAWERHARPRERWGVARVRISRRPRAPPRSPPAGAQPLGEGALDRGHAIELPSRAHPPSTRRQVSRVVERPRDGLRRGM